MTELETSFINELIKLLQLEAIDSITTFLEGEDALLRCLFIEKITNPVTLSKKLNITKGRVSVLLKSLQKKGYIDITINQDDHRKFDLSLSDKGKQYFEEKSLRAQKYFSILFQKLGKEKSIELVKMLSNINEVMKGVTL